MFKGTQFGYDYGFAIPTQQSMYTTTNIMQKCNTFIVV
jgi:hypothetical protein